MNRTVAPIRYSSCMCGRVRCETRGAPIVSVVCYCDDCQEGARRIEALANAAAFRDADGGTSLLAYRDDRFKCLSGEDLLVPYRLKDNSPTRRMVASCCNSAMFLKFEPGFWVSAYRARFGGDDLPPLEIENSDRAPQSRYRHSQRRAGLSRLPLEAVRQGFPGARRHGARTLNCSGLRRRLD